MLKTREITITAEGRDKGKIFILTEMPAAKAEKWAMRLLLSVARGGIHLDEGMIGMGMLALTDIGLRALGSVPWDVAEPLMDEMFEHVKIKVELAPEGRALIDHDILEVSTRIKLRKELLDLHTDFFAFAAPFRAKLEAALSRLSAQSPAQTSPD